MAFFNSAVGVLQTLVVALGAGLGIWGAINLLEGYGNDNPGANGRRRCRPHRHHPRPAPVRTLRLIVKEVPALGSAAPADLGLAQGNAGRRHHE